jgi:hypothetical protein
LFLAGLMMGLLDEPAVLTTEIAGLQGVELRTVVSVSAAYLCHIYLILSALSHFSFGTVLHTM